MHSQHHFVTHRTIISERLRSVYVPPSDATNTECPVHMRHCTPSGILDLYSTTFHICKELAYWYIYSSLVFSLGFPTKLRVITSNNSMASTCKIKGKIKGSIEITVFRYKELFTSSKS